MSPYHLNPELVAEVVVKIHGHIQDARLPWLIGVSLAIVMGHQTFAAVHQLTFDNTEHGRRLRGAKAPNVVENLSSSYLQMVMSAALALAAVAILIYMFPGGAGAGGGTQGGGGRSSPPPRGLPKERRNTRFAIGCRIC